MAEFRFHDINLCDDNFATIVTAIEEVRKLIAQRMRAGLPFMFDRNAGST